MKLPNALANRECLGFVLNEMGLLGDGVEIGVAAGDFSRLLVSQWKGKTLWLIDPWQSQADDVYRESTNQHGAFGEWIKAVERLAEENEGRVKILQSLSVSASTSFADSSLDFAYIDANHAYGAVMADLDAWWPKVKSGGIMGGHDYKLKTNEGWFCEVEPALNRWAGEHNVPFTVTPCTSWWIFKR